MMAGSLPFEGESAMEMIGAILKDEPKLLAANVPTEITKIINECLRKDRTERYQTIKDVLIDLKDVKQNLEFQDKLEHSIIPNREEKKTQILQATTADEIKQTRTNQTAANNPAKKYLTAALAILLVSAIGFFGYRYLTTNHNQIESIAVMPFVNESSNADNEYLSDGMTESLIGSLSQIPKLNVKARSSVFRYKGKEIDLQKVAQELNVQAILTGRVLQRGDQLILNLELVDARSENVIWSEQYNRRQADLVSLQSEIARDVSNKLKTKLSGADEQKVAKNYTQNTEAYQLYLKGRYFLNQGTREGLEKSVEYFQQAVNLDDAFALGYAGMADAYTLLGTTFAATLKPREAMPKARVAAQKALEIEPNLSEAHTSLAWIKYRFD
jgi:TolB-like protein